MTTEEHILGNPVLRAVQDVLDNQVAKGYAKYGTTVKPQDYTTQQWINHASEEAMDFVVYLQTLAMKLDKMQDEYDRMKELFAEILKEAKAPADYEQTLISIRTLANWGLNND